MRLQRWCIDDDLQAFISQLTAFILHATSNLELQTRNFKLEARTLFVYYIVSRKYILMKDLLRRVKTRIRAKIEDFYSRPGIVKRVLRVLTMTLLCIFSSIAILIIAIWLGMFGEIPE